VGCTRRQSRGVKPTLAVKGVEAKEAHYPQIIFRDARLGIPHKADTASLGIVNACADGIKDAALRVTIKRIHSEIASLGVGQPIVSKNDLGVAAIGGNIGSKGCHFHRLARWNRRHRPVCQACGHHFDAGRF
jgi:hypothetical protein